MRAVFALVLVVGMALAGLAVFWAQSYVSESENAVARANALKVRTGNLVQVYAVNKVMKFGSALTQNDVAIIYVQEKFLPAGAYVVPEDGKVIEYPETATKTKSRSDDEAIPVPTGPLFAENEDKPRFIRRSMEPNEIILASRVTEAGQMAGLTGKLEKGMRAFQIKVDVASGVAGFVQPDDHIDIYWTGSSNSSSGGDVTRLIESAVRIIAVDQASGEGQSSIGTVARTVTVSATPEQVARLAQAQATGRLAMSLGADGADVVSGLVEVDSNSLLGIVQQDVVAVEAEKECTIKTRKGADVVEIPIPCTN
ncbi:MAG: Flp pilus assembly protein CpaB [Paracoccaceae bacterium]